MRKLAKKYSDSWTPTSYSPTLFDAMIAKSPSVLLLFWHTGMSPELNDCARRKPPLSSTSCSLLPAPVIRRPRHFDSACRHPIR